MILKGGRENYTLTTNKQVKKRKKVNPQMQKGEMEERICTHENYIDTRLVFISLLLDCDSPTDPRARWVASQ